MILKAPQVIEDWQQKLSAVPKLKMSLQKQQSQWQKAQKILLAQNLEKENVCHTLRETKRNNRKYNNRLIVIKMLITIIITKEEEMSSPEDKDVNAKEAYK